jgi:hypothetical protein
MEERKMKLCIALVLALVLATSAFALDRKAYTMRDDFGTEPLYDCYMNYYYYIPCPTSSWFWAYSGFTPGDIMGEFFVVGDISTFTGVPCDPVNDHVIEQLRVLDFAGYGTVYPGLFTVVFDIYCSDAAGCAVGPSLWNSGPFETAFAWNYVPVVPPVTICDCAINPGPPPSGPRVLVTATHIGTNGAYPAWGMDNISSNFTGGCLMHDYSCLPVLFPRPITSHYPGVLHSAYYGTALPPCPVAYFCDGADTSPNCTQWGFIELAWRIYLVRSGPTATEPSTWGNIKSMYR